MEEAVPVSELRGVSPSESTEEVPCVPRGATRLSSRLLSRGISNQHDGKGGWIVVPPPFLEGGTPHALLHKGREPLLGGMLCTTQLPGGVLRTIQGNTMGFCGETEVVPLEVGHGSLLQ